MFRDSLSRQLKCNLDGAIFEDSFQVGVGGVIQNEVTLRFSQDASRQLRLKP